MEKLGGRQPLVDIRQAHFEAFLVMMREQHMMTEQGLMQEKYQSNWSFSETVICSDLFSDLLELDPDLHSYTA